MHYPTTRAAARSDAPEAQEEDVLLRVDRKTAEMLKLISEELGFSMREVLRWLVWFGRKSLGRKVLIEGDERVIKMSLEEYKKLAKMDLD
jgi:hypothetical protein